MIITGSLLKKEKLLSLHRYYIWANKMLNHFDETLKSTPNPTSEIEAFMYLSYWYATIYVVTEGWIDLGLKDDTIDSLLKSHNLNLLKKYRNGVFHYQKHYNDQRFLGLIKNGEDVVNWVRSLNQELGRYFLNELKK